MSNIPGPGPPATAPPASFNSDMSYGTGPQPQFPAHNPHPTSLPPQQSPHPSYPNPQIPQYHQGSQPPPPPQPLQPQNLGNAPPSGQESHLSYQSAPPPHGLPPSGAAFPHHPVPPPAVAASPNLHVNVTQSEKPTTQAANVVSDTAVADGDGKGIHCGYFWAGFVLALIFGFLAFCPLCCNDCFKQSRRRRHWYVIGTWAGIAACVAFYVILWFAVLNSVFNSTYSSAYYPLYP